MTNSRGKIITIKNKSNEVKVPKAEIRLLPCKINQEGVCSLKTYFNPKPFIEQKDVMEETQESDAQLSEVHLRGRKLIGQSVPINSSYNGLVFVEKNESEWEIESSFTEYTVFEHDNPPHVGSHPFILSMDWLDMSKALHAHTPIDLP